LALIAFAVMIFAAIYGATVIRRGFSTRTEPSYPERIVARAVRNLSIPGHVKKEANPWKATPATLKEGREIFTDRCASCHGIDGAGQTAVGRNLYPKPPDLRAPLTQNLADGEIHYIIENGMRLTGMPAWGNLHEEQGDTSWKPVLFIRDLRQSTPAERARQQATAESARYVGSAACEKCHAEIYEHWKKTPMANVVRDPREHPDAIIPDLRTNPINKFTKEQVALVYGSVWKQRYFTKIGDDYFPQPAQWDVTP
jgi:mono/diheme cytochrome c family protein